MGGVFAADNSILMDIAYFAAIGAGTVLCFGGCYLFFVHCFLIDRTKSIKLPAPVELVLVKVVAWEEDMNKNIPERQLNRGELRKKREREREQARLEEEEALNAAAHAERVGHSNGADGSRPGTAASAPARADGGSAIARLFGCAKKHVPISPGPDSVPRGRAGKHQQHHHEGNEENGEGEGGDRGGEDNVLKRKKKKKNKEKDGDEEKNEEGNDDAAFEAEAEADLERGEGEGWVTPGPGHSLEMEMEMEMPSLTSNTLGAPSLEKNGVAPVHSSAAAEKARRDAANKLKRRRDKAQAAGDAEVAEQKRLADEAYAAMLAAESAEQKEVRRREKEEAREREKREREEAAEAARLRHVQDGLAMAFNKRREGAMLAHLFNPSGTEEGPGNLGAKSLFDIDPDVRTRTLIDDRLDARFLEKQESIQAGVRDVVLENAGPSAAVLPPGWLADPLMPFPLHINQMNHRRCMVVFNEPKAKGWFFGTVSGESRRKGYNYSVKFDKQETASIEIDGIKSVNFCASGEYAYGKGWVLCHRDPDVPVPVPGAQFESRPATSAASASAPPQSRPDTQGMSRPATQGDGAVGSFATRPSSRAA